MTASPSAAETGGDEPDTRPISWCRIFAVGPPCAHLCEDCTRTAVAKRKDERVRRA